MTISNQPGWYDDPENANAQRYWDGQNWTPQRQRKPTPQQQPPPPPNLPPPAGPMLPPPGSHSVPAGLAVAKGSATKLSMTAWLLFGGFVLTPIATFFPLVTVSSPLTGSVEVSARGATLGPVFVLVAVAAAFAYPALSQSRLAVWRLIGISVVVGLLSALMLKWFSDASASDEEGLVSASPGFGLVLYGAAVIAMAVGTVRLWILHRSQTQNRSY